MKLRKLSVVLLALLLAAMAMVPMVSAADDSKIQINPLEKKTLTIDGITLPVVYSKSIPYDSSKTDNVFTKEKFLADNQEYIDYLAEKYGKETALKLADEEYTRRVATMKIGVKSVSSDIVNLWGYDIYLWPYESKEEDQTIDEVNPITFVVFGNTKTELKSYLTSHGWSTGYGWSDYGLRGTELNSLDWENTGYVGVEKALPNDYRYHCTLHSGLSSTILNDNWCFGECHYEKLVWDGIYPAHSIETNGFTLGENQIYQTLSASDYTAYWNSMNNAMSGYFNGMGHVFID